jgi:hypothetical protein
MVVREESGTVGSDLLWGVEAIAAEIGQTPRQTYYQLEKGQLPAGKQRGKWISSRSRLRMHFAQLVSGKENTSTSDTGAAA